MSRLERPKILVIGELNVDIVATGLRSAPLMGSEILAEKCELTLGSASAIFAAGMAKLGHEVTFFSQVGRDHFGDFCLRALKQSGVSTRHVIRNDKETTGVTIALSGKRDRALVTYAGAVATFTADSIDETVMSKHDHLHLTSYYLQTGLRPSFPRLLRQAKAAGLTTSFDPNSDPHDKWDRKIDSVLKHTDVLFLNEREAKRLTRSNSLNGALKTLGAKVNCAVVKRGARGATAIQNEQLFNNSGFKINAIDTTGAGDAFNGALAVALGEARPLGEALRFANAAAALACTRRGAQPSMPARAEVERLLRS